MICFSLPGTVKLIDKLSEDYDVDVLFWSDNFKEAVKVNIKLYSCFPVMPM